MTTIFAMGKQRLRLLLIFFGGVAVGIGTLIVLADLLRRPQEPLGAVPRDRDSVLVLKWLLDTRPDAGRLRFVAWWPPLRRPDNPFTHHPALLVHVALTGEAHGDRELEDLLVYVQDDQVLGAVPNGRGDSDPRAPLWTDPSESTVSAPRSRLLSAPDPNAHHLNLPIPRG
jgi:hypothetical protein